MEKEAEAVGLTLQWADYGPDFTMFDGRQLTQICQLMKRYGEIRVRYVAHLVASLSIFDDKQRMQRLRAIQLGLRDSWFASGDTVLLGNIRNSRPDYDFRIPWLKDYGVPAELRPLIEELSTRQFLSPQRSPAKRWQSIGPNADRLAPFLTADGLLLPDFQAINVIAWLARIGGQEDYIEGIEKSWHERLVLRPGHSVYDLALEQIRRADIDRC